MLLLCTFVKAHLGASDSPAGRTPRSHVERNQTRWRRKGSRSRSRRSRGLNVDEDFFERRLIVTMVAASSGPRRSTVRASRRPSIVFSSREAWCGPSAKAVVGDLGLEGSAERRHGVVCCDEGLDRENCWIRFMRCFRGAVDEGTNENVTADHAQRPRPVEQLFNRRNIISAKLRD